MALEPKDKELVAIGASTGAGCSPCLDHHIEAGRNAGLTEPQLARAVTVAEDIHHTAVELLSRHSRELVHGASTVIVATPQPERSSPSDSSDVLVALGTSLGANCHPILEQHVSGAFERGLALSQVRSAVNMAEIVQRNAAEITARKATAIFDTADVSAISRRQ